MFESWQEVVANSGVTGFTAHDARLVAVMEVYSLTHILTFNTRHFDVFPGIIVVDPATV